MKDGSQICFWEDRWLGTTPLCDQYPCLYTIARPKQTTIAEVLSTYPPNLSWQRDLVGPKLVAWNNLLPRIANLVLSHEPDANVLLSKIAILIKREILIVSFSDRI